jgi:UDP-glucose-4-epimerase GalE
MLVLLDAMRAHGVARIVFSSSAATYGTPQQVPILENAPQVPVNPYGESKLMGEHMLRWFGDVHGLGHVSLRYFNACGADPDGEIGEAHDPESHLIPLVIDAALGRRQRIEIFGTDYETPDGTAIRDYIHVQDLADAHVKALEHLLAGGASVALNLGTGIGQSVREVVAAVERVMGRPVPQHEGPRRAGDPPVLVADPARAKALFLWTPMLSDLNTIVSTALKPRQAGFAGLGRK